MDPENDAFQKGSLLFQGLIFRFHVKLQGCMVGVQNSRSRVVWRFRTIGSEKWNLHLPNFDNQPFFISMHYHIWLGKYNIPYMDGMGFSLEFIKMFLFSQVLFTLPQSWDIWLLGSFPHPSKSSNLLPASPRRAPVPLSVHHLPVPVGRPSDAVVREHLALLFGVPMFFGSHSWLPPNRWYLSC